MNKTHTSKLLAATLIASGLMGAASSAFADEYVTQANKEQYAVAAGELHAQPLLPLQAAPMSYAGPGTSVRSAPADADYSFSPQEYSRVPYGPFSDADPHSGPAHNE